MPSERPPLQFESLSSAVDTSFWHALASLKLDVFKLDDAAVKIAATYGPGRVVLPADASGGPPTPMTGRLNVSGSEAFALSESGDTGASVSTTPDDILARKWTPLEFASPGTLYNTNTQEEFKDADKSKLLKAAGDKLWSLIKTDPSAIASQPSLLAPFVLLTYADLKRFKFYFWFAFPAFVPKVPFTVSSMKPAKEALEEAHLSKLRTDYFDFRTKSGHGDVGFFLIGRNAAGALELASLAAYESLRKTSDEVLLGFVDPSALPQNPGWPLRNFLTFARKAWNMEKTTVLCFRDLYDRPDMAESVVCEVEMPEPFGDECPELVGWERNAKGQLGPRLVDLGSIMDPTRLMDSAVDLNLKLMRWRALPSLDLAKIASTKCLLLGAGTLGCYVARTLMGWGIRTISFVDYGKVSYSNPVRQPLFDFEDAKAGKGKAMAAAEALKKIHPGMDAKGYEISIPMPGHPIHDPIRTEADIARLAELIESHDAVFLLTDSRESRWLGTVLGRAKGKIVVNAALGFDTYLVMRHGAEGEKVDFSKADLKAAVPGSELGCYFCNDVVAPKDSLSDRTLDQQCTVTRPGVASLAGSYAAELLVSIVSHPLGNLAPASPPTAASESTGHQETTGSPLGIVPHQMRGFLGTFSNMTIVGRRFTECTACSDQVIDSYRSRGFEFLRTALEDPKQLEEITGLAELHRKTEAVDVEGWDDEEEEGEGDEDDF